MDGGDAGPDNSAVRSRLPWLLLLLFLVVPAGGYYFSQQAKGEDRELPVYVTGGERMAAGQPIYQRGRDKKPFTYPPFAAVPFVPFARLPAAVQPYAWFGINLAIVLLVLRWLVGWFRRQQAPPPDGVPMPVRRTAAFVAVMLLIGGHHVLSVFGNQSHDLLILGLVALTAAAWCRGRADAGFWAGAGAAVKATPLLFAGLFALRRRPGALLLLLLGGASLSLLPDLLWPAADGRSWLVSWYEVNLRGLQVGGTAEAPGAWGSHSVLNQGLSGTLTRLFSAPPPDADRFAVQGVVLVELPKLALRIVTLVTQLGVLALIAFGVRRAGTLVRGATDGAVAQDRFGLAECALVACGMVLLSPQSSKAHFCIWLLPAALLAERLLRGPRDPLLWLLVGCGLLLDPFASKGLLGRELGNLVLAAGNVTWCTVLLLLATLRVLCTSTTDARASADLQVAAR